MADDLERLKAALADRYAIEWEIGRGGMATVYLAEDRKHHRKVAVKVLGADVAALIGPERFLREIELAAGLTHPHILPVHDSGEADGLLYYVMPYVEGESLRNRLQREKQLSVEDALRISLEVADALSYAHSQGVIHRDIKPENILLQSGHAVVADFGIARAIDRAGWDTLTGTGIPVGTPAYMSPEQAVGSKDLDGRSDLYSLGCVLYEMLAGHPPFMGSSVEGVVYQHISTPPTPITSIRPAVPAQVAAALDRALAKTPADRFNPVALFAEALAPRGLSTPLPEAPGTGGSGEVAAAGGRWGRPPSLRFSRKLVGVVGVGVLVVVVGALGLGRWTASGPSGRSATATHERTAIAVLPFQNLSAEGPHSYFAAGLHDELLSQLAKVAAISLRGRTSVMGYAGTTKTIRAIADELSVGALVEGSVQVVGDRLRVVVQLIDARTDEHLWAERYDRSLDDAFAVQSDIAQRIVAALGATLTGPEATAIAAAPTENPEAYRLYLQGMGYYRRPDYITSSHNFEVAQAFYEKAVAADTTFALAYAALSDVHGRMSWHGYDRSPMRLERQREAAEKALRLAPDLPRAHLAMGLLHYLGEKNWQGALNELHIALEHLPNDTDIWFWLAAAHRRLGNWEEALHAFETVVALDPRRADALQDLGGGTLRLLRRYPESIEFYSRSLALAPYLAEVDVRRGWTWVRWQGTLDSVRAALDRHPEHGASVWHSSERALVLHWERDADSLFGLLHSTSEAAFVRRDSYRPNELYSAWAQQLRGDEAAARRAFQSALIELDSAVAVLPDDWRVHAARGLALAGLGLREEALSESRWLQRSAFYREDHYEGINAAVERARILAQVGADDSALAEIERLLASPSQISVQNLRLDPLFDPIRHDPRFQALLVKYANPEGGG
jgi:eukaryotic-like serine/threonine-protein kinase